MDPNLFSAALRASIAPATCLFVLSGSLAFGQSTELAEKPVGAEKSTAEEKAGAAEAASQVKVKRVTSADAYAPVPASNASKSTDSAAAGETQSEQSPNDTPDTSERDTSSALNSADDSGTSASEMKSAIASARSLSKAFRFAAEKALPSVVMIKTASKKEGDDEKSIRDVLNRTFDGVGSGVIVRADGTVLTNHHVIADAARIQVRLSDSRAYTARVLQSDPKSDIAILKISGSSLPTASLGDSDQLFVGDWVMAIGSPFALESSVSAGIISGADRWHRLSKTVSGQFLQTDASINPGNSGGALIDLEGNIVGINTAISSRNGGFQGIGFAIPISRAKWIMSELEQHGRVRRGYAGVGTSDVPFSVARQLELPGNKGAYVQKVVPGYAADKGGLKRGDVVLEFRGRAIDSASEFVELIQQSPVEEALPITILRSGDEKQLSITLTERD